MFFVFYILLSSWKNDYFIARNKIEFFIVENSINIFGILTEIPEVTVSNLSFYWFNLVCKKAKSNVKAILSFAFSYFLCVFFKIFLHITKHSRSQTGLSRLCFFPAVFAWTVVVVTIGNVVNFDADAVGVSFVTVTLPFVLSRLLGMEGVCLVSLLVEDSDCGLFCKQNSCCARFSFIDVEFINRRELQWRIIDDVITVCQCVRGRVAESIRPRFLRNHTFCNSDWT